MLRLGATTTTENMNSESMLKQQSIVKQHSMVKQKSTVKQQSSLLFNAVSGLHFWEVSIFGLALQMW